MRATARRLLSRMAAIVASAIIAGLFTGFGPGVPQAMATTPSGWTPANLRSAYGFQSPSEGGLQTVAVVTALDDPAAESDLATYRSQFGLPACTAADGCFRKVSQTGGTTYPAQGWSKVDAESLDAISAVCVNCQILLVEANSNSLADLGAAENEAVVLGARVIDNTWSVLESAVGAAETTDDGLYFNHPGVAITAPAGNSGYGVGYPAASPYVTAVGGTVLTQDAGVARGWDEQAWPSSGAGCSIYEAKPSWQTDTGCADRSVNDIAAVATNVAYYDSLTSGGWSTSAGTEVSAAIIAAAYALAGTPAAGSNPASYPYRFPGGTYTTPGNAFPYVDGLTDISTGSADGTCPVTYQCTPGAGYDGPTGVGTPSAVISLSGAGALTGHFYGFDGMCITDQGDAATDGTLVVDFPCQLLESQGWTVQPNGTIRIHSTECMYITGAATANGSPVQLAACNPGNGGMQWIPRADGTLYNPRSGRCLYNSAGTTQNVQLVIQDCGTSRLEYWPLPYPGPPSVTGPVTSQVKPTLCIDDHSSITTDGNPIDIHSCNGTSAQAVTIIPDGSLTILGKCIDTLSDGITAGAAIILHACDGDSSQHWAARSDGTLLNIRSGQQTCLDDPGSSTTDNTQLQLAVCGSAIDQEWNTP
jgi:hypothetical protein